MNKKTVIFLLALIAALVAVIVAGVCVLYSGVGTNGGMTSALVPEIEEVEKDSVELTSDEAEESPAPDEKKQNVEEIKLPQSFQVHNCGTGKLNTLRQNADKSLELVDENGKSLWKINLKSPVCGAVGEVDFYDNKKIQFLLCEGSRMHLIDRLGREVTGFPKTLPFTAVKGPVESVSGQGKCWRIDTAYGPVFYDTKATQIITRTEKQ